MPRARKNKQGQMVIDSSNDSDSDWDRSDHEEAFYCQLPGPSGSKSKTKKAKRMKKRNNPQTVSINFLHARSEVIVPSDQIKSLHGAIKKFREERKLTPKQLVAADRKHLSQQTLITIIGKEEHRCGLVNALRNRIVDYLRTLGPRYNVNDYFKCVKAADGDSPIPYCGVCYNSDHNQEDCQNCSYCQTPGHYINNCPKQTIVAYTTDNFKVQHAIFEDLRERAWECPVRISAYDAEPGVESARRYVCRILGPQHKRLHQLTIIKNRAHKYKVVKGKDEDPFDTLCMVCFAFSHETKDCAKKFYCPDCKVFGHSKERCIQVTLLKIKNTSLGQERLSTPLKGTLQQLERADKQQPTNDKPVKFGLHICRESGMVVIYGPELRRRLFCETLANLARDTFENLEFVRKTDTAPLSPYCLTCCSASSGHWTSDCPVRKAQQQKRQQNQPSSSHSCKPTLKQQLADQQSQVIWRYNRYFAKLTGITFDPNDKESPCSVETIDSDGPKILFLAADVEKGHGVGATWGLCVCVVATLMNGTTIPVYFAYINNSDKLIVGLEYSSVTNRAVLTGISPARVKDDLLQLMKGHIVWFHQADNDLECLGITDSDIDQWGITIKDTSEVIRDELHPMSLRDIVYTTFKDKYGRPKKIQEYSDDYVALGGHNAEVDARYTAKIAWKIHKNEKFMSCAEMREVILEAKNAGLIFKEKRVKKKA